MNKSKKKKGGRPAGSKSKVNLPSKSIEESIEWAKKIYVGAKNNEFHPDDLPNYLGIGRGFASPTLSILAKYGLIEKATFGWVISELGKNAINGSRESTIECLERIDLFRELFREFGDKRVNRSIIIAHLKSRYKYGDNNEVIADRFIESKEYLVTLMDLGVDAGQGYLLCRPAQELNISDVYKKISTHLDIPTPPKRSSK